MAISTAQKWPRGLDGIVLGKDLAAKLRVEVGDEVSLLTAQGTLTDGHDAEAEANAGGRNIQTGLLEADSTFGYRLDPRQRNVSSTRIRWITFSCASMM